MRQILSGVLIAVAAVIFAIQNAEPVTVRLYFWSIDQTSLALILLMTFIIGLATGLLFMAPAIYRRNRSISELRKKSGITNENFKSF